MKERLCWFLAYVGVATAVRLGLAVDFSADDWVTIFALASGASGIDAIRDAIKSKMRDR